MLYPYQPPCRMSAKTPIGRLVCFSGYHIGITCSKSAKAHCMEKYCQNPLCENEAVKQVPVSVREASDQKRSLCATCEEAYSWGVQQGTMSQKGLLTEPPPRET